jgi:hypothetical protein
MAAATKDSAGPSPAKLVSTDIICNDLRGLRILAISSMTATRFIHRIQARSRTSGLEMKWNLSDWMFVK